MLFASVEVWVWIGVFCVVSWLVMKAFKAIVFGPVGKLAGKGFLFWLGGGK